MLNKKSLTIIFICLAVLCAAVVISFGGTYTSTVYVYREALTAENCRVEPEHGDSILVLTDKRVEGNQLLLTYRSAGKGREFVDIYGPDDFKAMQVFHVNRFGVITEQTLFGNSRRSIVIPIAAVLFLLLLLAYLIKIYRKSAAESIYQYRNIRLLGLIIFLAVFTLQNVMTIFSYRGLLHSVQSILGAASMFSVLAFPLAFLVSVFVAFSSIRLMRREGRNWRNMLGLILGLLVCFGTIFPELLGEYLQRSTVIDVHNQRGAALYIEMAVENTIFAVVAYLECILLGTVILSVKAARMLPTFDEDYILILGCRVAKDGSPTPLLRGRADRALEFARLQKEKTGKEPVFVPSGGKGADEPVSEAACIKAYLISQGVPEGRILAEDASASTQENFENSLELIRAHAKAATGTGEPQDSGFDPKIAFSTTNYHVFRSGIIARQLGINAQGAGSRTKSYFWINAFVREFIATLYSERKSSLRIIAVLVLITLSMDLMVYLANTV